MERGELHRGRILEICQRFVLSIQLSNNQHMHIRKLHKARGRSTQNIRGDSALKSPGTGIVPAPVLTLFLLLWHLEFH